MLIISWSAAALDELRAIDDYLCLFDQEAARRVAQRIMAAAKSLADFPRRGREVQPGIRQLSIVYPYLIRYRITSDTVEILSVRHGARHETD